MATITCETVDNKPARLDEEVVLNAIYPGDQFALKLNGSPLDLTDATIKAEYREKEKTGAVAKTATIGDGISIIGDPVNGVFASDPFTPTSPTFTAITYWRDFLINNISEGPLIPVEGEFKVLQNVTQP